MNDDRGQLLGAVAVGVGVLVVLALIGWYAALVPISEGYEGVHTDRGATTGEVFEPGWNYHNPITQGYQEVETRPVTVNFAGDDHIRVLTQDGQDVYVDVTVRYRVTDAVTMFEEYYSHGQLQDRLIHPTVRSDMRDEASAISAREIITREGRQGLESTALEALQENAEGSGVTVENVQVRNVELNEEFSDQLEQVEIENTEADRLLIEAEAKAAAEVAEAEGAAEAYEIRSEALDDLVLTEAFIDSIDDTDKVLIALGDDGSPVILDATDGTEITVEEDDD